MTTLEALLLYTNVLWFVAFTSYRRTIRKEVRKIKESQS